MFQATQDFFFLAATLSVIILTFFLSWLLFYLIHLIKHAHNFVKGLKDGLESLSEILASIKEKLEHSSTYLKLLVDLINKALDLWRDKKRGSDNELPKLTSREE